MPVSPDYEDAYVHYLTMFPDLASLGTLAADWRAELDRVAATAFDPVLATNIGMEGGNVSGQMGFRQRNLVRALHAIRALRETGYANPYATQIDDPKPGHRIGSVIRVDGNALETSRFPS